MPAPQVRKIIDPPKLKTRKIHPNLPQPHAQILMVMPCKCGKSTIASNLIINNDFFGLDYFGIPPLVISNSINTDSTSHASLKSVLIVMIIIKIVILMILLLNRNLMVMYRNNRPPVFLSMIALVIKRRLLITLCSRYRHSAIFTCF